MSDNPLRIAFVPVAKPTFDTALAAEMAARARGRLLDAGHLVFGPESLVMDPPALAAALDGLHQAEPIDLLVVFQASFADSSMAQALAQEVDAPVLLWAVPEAHEGGRLRLNSFCGINLAGHGLRRAGIGYEHVYADPGDPAALALAGTVARAGRARRLLASANIGRVGEHPEGFEPCSYDGRALAERLGVRVTRFQLGRVFAAVRALPAGATDDLRAGLGRRVAGLDALDDSAVRGTLGVYHILRDLASAEKLDGLAVRCWPEFFTDLGCAACGALSLLADDGDAGAGIGATAPGIGDTAPGIACSCEADVNGTITTLMLRLLSGGPAFGTDIVSADRDRDAAVLWHCGLMPLSLADLESPPRGTIHSNRKLPLLMEFPLKPGRVTVARLSEATGDYRLVVAGGEMLRAPMSFTGTSGVLRFDRPVADVFDAILDEGLEHHVSVTYGDHVPALLTLARMLGLPALRLA